MRSNEGAGYDLRRPKLALVSLGLGRVQRGYEVSTARWYEALSGHPGVEVRLFSGGEYPRAERVWSVAEARTARSIAHRVMTPRWRHTLGSAVVGTSLRLGLLASLLRWRPDVVWTKSAVVARRVGSLRRLLRRAPRVIFANGGPVGPATYARFDLIQQLTTERYDEALAFGVPEKRMRLLPNFIPPPRPAPDRNELRRELGYQASDWVVMSAAAWNRHHKRIDYLIEEVAAMTDPSVKLLLCGQPEAETASLKALAERRLGSRVQWATLQADEVRQAMLTADVFVLASLSEALGMALIEAALAGVPLVAHPNEGSRFVLADDPSWLVDLSEPGNLTRRLTKLRRSPPPAEHLARVRDAVGRRFSSPALVEAFVEMVHSAATMPERAASELPS